MMKLKVVLSVASLLMCTYFLHAQDFKAQEILMKVNQAMTEKAQAVHYEYTYKGWGKLAGAFAGEVKLSRKTGVQLLVQLNSLNEAGAVKKEETFFTDGNRIQALNQTDKTYRFGTASGGSGYLSSYIWYAVFRESLMPQPFTRILKDSTLNYEGTQVVGGVECHIVSVQSPYQGDRDYWFFGKEDHLIHGQRKVNENPDTEGGFVFEMINLKTDAAFESTDFELSIPTDFNSSNEDERALKVGSQGPAWQLPQLGGEEISSEQLKGQVVVLDFWASWCPPCWKIMPMIQAIKTAYAGNRVKVYGVNVWESPALDVSAYLARKNLKDYEVLMDTDAEVAKKYKIFSLPLVVVLDTKGQIAYMSNGMDPELENNVRAAIEKSLE